jgi:hypothetical protein
MNIMERHIFTVGALQRVIKTSEAARDGRIGGSLDAEISRDVVANNRTIVSAAAVDLKERVSLPQQIAAAEKLAEMQAKHSKQQASAGAVSD